LLNLTADTEHREHAIAALTSLSAEVFETICEGLDHRHSMVRTAVVEVLLRIRSPLASARLASCLQHTDAKVRLATIQALHRLGNSSYVKQLIDVKNSDPDPFIRRAAEDVLQTNSQN